MIANVQSNEILTPHCQHDIVCFDLIKDSVKLNLEVEMYPQRLSHSKDTIIRHTQAALSEPQGIPAEIVSYSSMSNKSVRNVCKRYLQQFQKIVSPIIFKLLLYIRYIFLSGQLMFKPSLS